MALTHSPSIVRTGLVLHLDAANPKSYPGTGTTWNDLSGQSNNGLLVNAPSMDPTGVILSATSYVSLANKSLSTSGLNNVSYSFFLKLNWLSVVGYKTIFGIQEGNFSKVASFVLNTNSSNLQFDFRNGASVERGIFDVNMASFANIPTQIVYTFQTGIHRLYINSVLISTYNGTATVFPSWSGTAGYAIGENLDSSRILSSGTFNNVMVYNRTLSNNEIAQNWEAQRGRYGI